jgi:hypothetical protein
VLGRITLDMLDGTRMHIKNVQSATRIRIEPATPIQPYEHRKLGLTQHGVAAACEDCSLEYLRITLSRAAYVKLNY